MSETPINPFDKNCKPDWCPGCGNYGIWASLKNAFVNLSLKPENVVVAGDIGCSSKLPEYVRAYNFVGLHGRVIPLASGIKLANHELTVVAVGGDGGIYGEGGNHLLHAARRNINMTVIVNDNHVYALTKGQASPTTDAGAKTSATPAGSLEIPLNPILVALASGASFVARGFAGDPPHLTKLIEMALTHKGFAIIDILQPCVSFNNVNTFQWYVERVYKLDEEKNHDFSDLSAALTKAQEWGDRIPVGLIYQHERPTCEEQIPTLKSKPLVAYNPDRIDISPLLSSFQ